MIKVFRILLSIFPFFFFGKSIFASSNEVSVLEGELFGSIWYGDEKRALEMLNEGVDINCANATGMTPLLVAIYKNHLQIVRMLLEHGAPINSANNVGITPLHLAVVQAQFEIVKDLLKNKRLQMNAFDDHECTPLFYAAMAGNTEMVKLLLTRSDIQINQIAANDKTPLEVAANQEIEQLLIERGGIRFAPVKQIMEKFITAVMNKDFKTLEDLISPEQIKLREELQAVVKSKGVFNVNMRWRPGWKNIQFISPTKVKISGICNAWGTVNIIFLLFCVTADWNAGEVPTSFVLEQKNGEWSIVETDFADKMGGTYFWGLWIFLFISFVFWMWMLIDCIKRDFYGKKRWFVLLLVFNVIGAIIYLFLIKIPNARKDD